jgi:hypothetical protein
MMNSEPGKTRQTLLDVQEHLAVWRRGGFLFHKFQVPPQASKVGLTLSFHKKKLAQLFLSLHSPEGFRGNVMNPSAKGEVVLNLWVSPDDSSEGGLVGPLPTGEWTAQINVERMGEETDYRLVVYADFDPVPNPLLFDYPENHIVKAEAGWYKGELHGHSTESDGKWPVEDVIQAVQDIGLDYFALTDHFTVSQWRKMAPLQNQRTALIRSCEITSHLGHANLHGIKRWVNVYVDQPGWSFNQAADDVHLQNGLFCVNHAFSGDLSMHDFDFDWHKADLIEVYHSLEGINNLHQISWWDHLLLTGHRIIGVGGTDSHHPYDGKHAMGNVLTWVYADELSEKGIIAGLCRGRVYISKGAEIFFNATNAAGESAEMWETLDSQNQPVTFHLRVKCEESLWLFIFKNGLLFDVFPIENRPGAWEDLSFNDQPSARSYYRVEFHKEFHDSTYPGLYWRDHLTFKAASNPIFVE